MLYLLGGAARSGKSNVARRVMAQYGLPFFCLDYLAQGVAEAWPEQQIDLDSDDASVGECLWPLVKAIATVILHDRGTYLLEGASLQPHNAQELMQAFPGQVQACFLGFAEADLTEKLHHVRQFGGQADDWMFHWDDALVVQELARLKNVSITLRAECQQYHIPYIETSLYFEQAITTVVEQIGGWLGTGAGCGGA